MNVLRHGLRFVAAASIILSAGASAAQAESAQPGRWFLTVGGGLQSTSEPASHGATFEDPLFGSEAGEWTADYGGGRGEAFELSLGFRLAPRWGVGASVSRLSFSEEVEVTGRIPHPFRFDRMSVVEGVGSGLSRDETTVSAHLMWFIPAGRKVEFALFAGPTFYEAEQDLVSGIGFDRSYPYDAADLRGVERSRQSDSPVGYNLGGELAWYFGRRTGVVAAARYSRSTAHFETAEGCCKPVDVGGLQTSLGLRVRF